MIRRTNHSGFNQRGTNDTSNPLKEPGSKKGTGRSRTGRAQTGRAQTGRNHTGGEDSVVTPRHQADIVEQIGTYVRTEALVDRRSVPVTELMDRFALPRLMTVRILQALEEQQKVKLLDGEAGIDPRQRPCWLE
jgi:hypothetical protein